MKNRMSSNRGGNKNDRISLWSEICLELCRLGGFYATLDGDRLHVKLKHRRLLQKFEDVQWLGWVSSELCCRFVPEDAEQVFWNEKEQFERATEHTFPSGDAPVNVLYETRGRLTIPAQLMVCSGNKVNDEVFCLPRICCVEVWKPSFLTAYVASKGPMVTSPSADFGQIPKNSMNEMVSPIPTR